MPQPGPPRWTTSCHIATLYASRTSIPGKPGVIMTGTRTKSQDGWLAWKTLRAIRPFHVVFACPGWDLNPR